MRIYKLYTTLLLLITITTFASCNESPKKNTSETKETQTNPEIKRVEAKAFKLETEDKKVQLVDVRTPKEFTQGHIKNAKNINVFDNDFMEKMSKFDKKQAVYVYCRSGGRSMKAAKMLKSKGFQVVNLNGGFMGWERSGYKSVK